MKITIVGCGKVGTTLAEQLNGEGHDITMIDKNPSILHSVTNRIDVMGVVGNGAVYQIQAESGIKDADLMIAVTNSDELNMLCCLIAKKAGNCQTIARIRNPEYHSEINYIREELGLSLAINPEMAAAREISRILRFPSANKIDTFAKGRTELLKFMIPEHSILNGIKVRDVMSKLRCDVLICAVERNDQVMIPTGDFELYSHDKIHFIGKTNETIKFFKAVGVEYHSVKSVMIVGGGKISYYLAKMLEDTKIRIKIIEQDSSRCNELSELLPKALIINGNGSDQDLLLEEGIDRTEAFASLTGFDEENIMLSLYVSDKCNTKVITKVNKISFERVINTMNLGSVIYPKLITSDIILQYVRGMENSMGSNIETLYKIVANKAEALEFRVKKASKVVGIPLEKLQLKENILIACINHNGHPITPRGKNLISTNDTVIVVTTLQGLNDIDDILR